MKIMWVCNTLIADIAEEKNIDPGKPESWIKGIYERIVKDDEIELVYLFRNSKNDLYFELDNAIFNSFIEVNDDKVEPSLIDFFVDKIKNYSPDIIHVFGTELPHAYAVVLASEKLNMLDRVVVSIQGLAHMIAEKYYAGIDDSEINRVTFRDFIKGQSYKKQKKNFINRGEIECKVLSSVYNVIGRTRWDYDCTKKINTNINYYFCNETLRDRFYSNDKWNSDSCEKHSIFVSQSCYPLKGFHIMLKEFARILNKYPDAHLYTTGDAPYAYSLLKKIKQTSYKRYLSEIIEKYDLREHVTFMGYLNEKAMYERLIKSNVLVSPSSIENSPNSIGEAMMLGVPVIASDVGGVSSIICHEQEGYLYSFESSHLISDYMEKIFDDIDITNRMSVNEIAHAKVLYHREANYDTLIKIYNEISNSR